MSRFAKSIAGLSAASLAFAPIAAQAGTRAETSPVAVERGSEGVVAGNEVSQFNLTWLLLLLAVIAAIVAAAGGGGNGGGRTRG